MGSSQIRGQIHVSCISKQILCHWANKKPHSCTVLYDSAIFHRFLQATFKLSLEWDKVFPIHTQKTQFNSGLNYYKNFLAGFPACFLLSQCWIPLPWADFIPLPSCSQSRLLGNITVVDVVFRFAFRTLHHMPTHFQLYPHAHWHRACAPGHPKWCHPHLAILNPAEPNSRNYYLYCLWKTA